MKTNDERRRENLIKVLTKEHGERERERERER